MSKIKELPTVVEKTESEINEIITQIKLTSLSASSKEFIISCIELSIWIPNAFLVGGFNDTFNPVISFADFEKYKMVIYGRWGDVMFSTEDVTEGWDGTFKGSLAPQGVYAYFITIQDGSGQVFDNRGTLTLLINDE